MKTKGKYKIQTPKGRHSVQLGEVQRKIQAALAQLDRSEGISGERAYAELKQKSAAFRKSR